MRYLTETKRLLGVLEDRLADRDFIMGADYTIADIAIFPWVRTLGGFYEAGDITGLNDLVHVPRWLDTCLARPAVARGLAQPA